MAIPEGAFLTLYFNNGTQLMQNVIGARVAGSVTFNQALANTLGSAIKSSWSTNMGPHCPASVMLVRVGIRDMRIDNQPEFRDTGAQVLGGAVGTDLLPRATACVITLRTALSGKSYRGRVYLGGFAESVNDVNANAASAVGTSGVAFITGVQSALTASQMQLAVLSRPALRSFVERHTFEADGTEHIDLLSTTNARSGAATPVTIIEARNTGWESQRRRTNQRGGLPTVLSGVVASNDVSETNVT